MASYDTWLRAFSAGHEERTPRPHGDGGPRGGGTGALEFRWGGPCPIRPMYGNGCGRQPCARRWRNRPSSSRAGGCSRRRATGAAGSSRLRSTGRRLPRSGGRSRRWCGSKASSPARSDALRADIAALLAGLADKRVALAGLEIDHDCATGRLAAYADFLERLRPSTPGLALSITALPAWLSSPLLDRALAAADGAVSCRSTPSRAPARAVRSGAGGEESVRAFGRRTKKPFRVALPGLRRARRLRGDRKPRLGRRSEERPLLAGGGDREELIASPADAARFIAAVERDPPPRLAGFVWFRLPTDRTGAPGASRPCAPSCGAAN